MEIGGASYVFGSRSTDALTFVISVTYLAISAGTRRLAPVHTKYTSSTPTRANLPRERYINLFDLPHPNGGDERRFPSGQEHRRAERAKKSPTNLP